MNLYTSIDTLPIFHFNRIRETGDMRYLIKGVDVDNLPDTDTKEFETTWEFIQEQYLDAINEARKRNNKVDVIKRIYRLECDKHLVSVLLLHFIMEPDPEVIKQLIRLGYTIDAGNMQTYMQRQAQASKIKQRTKTIDAKISVLARQIEEQSTSNNENIDFDSIVWTAEKHFQRSFDIQKISVKRWIKIETDLLKAVEDGKNKK